MNVSAADSSYTDPDQVQEFVQATGVDSLAIAIGTSHGLTSSSPAPSPSCGLTSWRRSPATARVPHRPPRASSVIPKYVEIINANGGQLKDAIGVPEDQLRQAAKMAVCKIMRPPCDPTGAQGGAFSGLPPQQSQEERP